MDEKQMLLAIQKYLDVENSTDVGFDPFHKVEDDFFLLKHVRTWLNDEDVFREEKYSWFYTCLSEGLRARDPYYKPTVNQYELYYMDLYEVGDFAKAFYLATTASHSNED